MTQPEAPTDAKLTLSMAAASLYELLDLTSSQIEFLIGWLISSAPAATLDALRATETYYATCRADNLALGQAAAGHTQPRYPRGTPEHDRYVAELGVELAKFAAGEHPYEIEAGADPAEVLV